MTDWSSPLIAAKFLVATHMLKDLLSKIDEIEKDPNLTVSEKRVEIKKIREDIAKVGTEIDNLKKEITLLNTHRVN
jgi:peptidoglycan hydrolase CwlO-like protein